MSATIADLRAKVSVDGAEKAKKDLQGLHGNVSSLGDSFKKGLGLVTGFMAGFGAVNIATDALGFLKDQIGDVIQQAEDAQAVEAQTNAVIKSTGGAAGITAKQVGDLATKLSLLTGVSDNNVQAVTNVLLTFTNLKKNVLPQATSLVLDLSRAMHEDLNSASIQLGKALQDPVQGVTALRRVGVQLSDQQAKMVKHFVDVGNVAGAQQVIIKELTKEVGGSAAAYGKTFPGQMDRFKASLDQAKEKIGLAILPVLSDMLNKYVMPLADWLGAHLPAAIDTLTTFLDNDLEPAIDALVNSPVVQTLEGWATAILGKVVPAVDSTTGLTGASNKAKGSLKGLSGQVRTTGTDLDPTYTGHLNAAITKVLGLTDAIDPKGAGDTSSHALTPAMRRADTELNNLSVAQQKQAQTTQQSIPVISGLGDLWQHATDRLGEFVANVEDRFPDANATVQRVTQFMVQTMGDQTGNMKDIWEGFWAFATYLPRFALDAIQGIVLTGMDIIGGHFDQAGKDIEQTMLRMNGDVEDGMRGLGRFLKGIGGELLNFMLAPFKIVGTLLKDQIAQVGKDFKAGWESMIASVQQFINSHTPHVPGINLPGIFGEHRASGGPVSGDFIGAERGPELLVTPGRYHAPPGSYVYNAQQTQQMLSGQGMAVGMGGGMGGRAIAINVYGSDYHSSMQIARDVRRQLSREIALHG